MVYSIEQFQLLNSPEKIVLTQHSRRRFMERGILLEDVENVIKNGSIIEEYPDDYPFPSCLILGKSNEKNLHVCASLKDDYIYIITAYIPDSTRWESDLKTRKEET